MTYLVIFLVLAIFGIRLQFLKISKRNEAAILADGGREYGVENSKRLTIAHILFYVSCFLEALLRQTTFDGLAMLGLVLLVWSFGMLYFIVHYLLPQIWTVKLMVAKNHRYNPHWLFQKVKHPNYYLNIVPELLGLTLLCHAWFTFLILAPIYAWILSRRIQEENRVLAEIIIPNSPK